MGKKTGARSDRSGRGVRGQDEGLGRGERSPATMRVKSNPFFTDFRWSWFGSVANPTYSWPRSWDGEGREQRTQSEAPSPPCPVTYAWVGAQSEAPSPPCPVTYAWVGVQSEAPSPSVLVSPCLCAYVSLSLSLCPSRISTCHWPQQEVSSLSAGRGSYLGLRACQHARLQAYQPVAESMRGRMCLRQCTVCSRIPTCARCRRWPGHGRDGGRSGPESLAAVGKRTAEPAFPLCSGDGDRRPLKARGRTEGSGRGTGSVLQRRLAMNGQQDVKPQGFGNGGVWVPGPVRSAYGKELRPGPVVVNGYRPRMGNGFGNGRVLVPGPEQSAYGKELHPGPVVANGYGPRIGNGFGNGRVLVPGPVQSAYGKELRPGPVVANGYGPRIGNGFGNGRVLVPGPVQSAYGKELRPGPVVANGYGPRIGNGFGNGGVPVPSPVQAYGKELRPRPVVVNGYDSRMGNGFGNGGVPVPGPARTAYSKELQPGPVVVNGYGPRMGNGYVSPALVRPGLLNGLGTQRLVGPRGKGPRPADYRGVAFPGYTGRRTYPSAGIRMGYGKDAGHDPYGQLGGYNCPGGKCSPIRK
ncbi:glycine-rich extracellular protein 1-like [Narcine bancroftii]|uniref:glycine-rich extracellular protein 1-like n=1 Tax=Narcine bancroftii TaxID=1343680 RepID=UPI003831014F